MVDVASLDVQIQVFDRIIFLRDYRTQIQTVIKKSNHFTTFLLLSL